MEDEVKERMDAIARANIFATKVDSEHWIILSQMLKVTYPPSFTDKVCLLTDIIQSFKSTEVCPDCGKVSLGRCNCGQ